jgi:hypothetical protein
MKQSNFIKQITPFHYLLLFVDLKYFALQFAFILLSAGTMEFFPYDCKALRCHPISALLDTSQTIPLHLTIGTAAKVRFLCSVCFEPCMRAPMLARRQTMKCKAHSKQSHDWHRQKYMGPIPLHIRRPIRAGLLLKVDRQALCNLVASLEPTKNAEDPIGLATNYIECIAQYDFVCLADNCFWGDDSSVRKNGVRVPHKKPNCLLDNRNQNHAKRQRRTIDAACQSEEATIIGDIENPYDTSEFNNLDATSTDDKRATIGQSDHLVHKGQQSEAGQVITNQVPAEHMWDDVLQAIHEDPRAFWGLWSTIIAPRLGQGVPQTYKEKTVWTASNVNINEVIARLMNLGKRVADVIENNELIIKEEAEATAYETILRNINNEALKIPGDEQLKDLKRAIGIIIHVNATPRFTYAMPVD